MSGTYLLGIDLGTSGVKVLLLPEGEQPAAEATVEYPLSTPHPGWSEQNPDDWWAGTTRAIRQVLTSSGIDARQVAGLALSGQMHGATLLDASGEVLRPCILWNDQRSSAECDFITDRIGLSSLLQWVANPALAGFTAPKLLWVRRHEPDVYRRIATVLLPKDYINYRLTGIQATEVSDASGTLLFDVAHRRWSDDMLSALEMPASILPPVYASTDILGTLTPEAATQTGLRQGTPVVAGGADNACAAVGTGVIHPGQAGVSIGTSGTVIAPAAEPRHAPQGELHTFCHAVPDTWYIMGVVLSAGGSLRWFRDTLAGDARRRADAEGRDPYELIMDEAASVPAGCEGLLFLPYLTGERTPHGDADARGCFFGLSLRHSHAHMARSVVEGVTYALADSVTIMRSLGLEFESMRATGGGSQSTLWKHMLADIFNARIETAPAHAGPALGAALLAGVGVGVFASVPEATERFAQTGDQIEPNRDLVPLYRRYHALYDRLYPALEAEFKALADLVAEK